jgi:hypothetical protein
MKATRIVAAAAVLVSAAVHLQMWSDGVRDQHVIGPAFLVNAVAGVVIAVLLVAWRSWPPLLLAVGFGAATLGAFVISTTVGLFDVHAEWEGFRAWAAAGAEVMAMVAGLFAAWQEGYLSGGQRQHRFAVRGPDLH